MRVLVTGASGFIGSCVVRHLSEAGHHPVPLVRRADPRWPDAAFADLSDARGLEAALRGVDAVIHCAAAMGGDDATQDRDTRQATDNLLAAMDQAEVQQLVLISSFAVYDYLGLSAWSLLDERSPLAHDFKKRDPYTRVKCAQERSVKAWGKRFTILRPGIVYGPGRTWFYHLGARTSPLSWLCFAPDSPIPMLHVEHCAAAIVSALTAADGEVINLVDDDPPTRRFYMGMLREHASPKPMIIDVPWTLLDVSAELAGLAGRALLGTTARLPGLLRSPALHARCKPLIYSNAKAKRLLTGYRSEPVSPALIGDVMRGAGT